MNQVVNKNSPEYRALVRPAPAAKAPPAQKIRRTPEQTAELRRRWGRYALSGLLGLSLCAGNLLFADINSDWYHELARPVYCPPLLVLYIAYVASILLFSWVYALVLTRGKSAILRFEFLFNALLQVLWAVFFFRLSAVFAALIVLLLLFMHTFFLLKFSRKQVGNIALLLLCHLVRIAFGILLNYSILVLN